MFGQFNSNTDEASLYVHVPFCAGDSLNARGKCDYCDFFSVPVNPPDRHTADSRLARYVETLLSEGERLFEIFRPGHIPTLYIGGGTPSVLGPAGISRLLRGLSELIARYAASPAEITVEANPESADEAFLAAARENGATRLSLGVQTFHKPSREAVHRIGNADLLPECLRLAAEYFPGAFSADIISGLPFQSENILTEDIAALLDYKPAHVSFYALTVEPENPVTALLPSKDEADRLWLAGRDFLERSGYSQYEVSNFRLTEKETSGTMPGGTQSRHNIRYWRMLNWLALGPAASGTVINDEAGEGFRYTIPQDTDAWLGAGGSRFQTQSDGIRSAFIPVTEYLDSLTLIKETFLMGFRYAEGPDEALFRRRFHKSVDELIPKTLAAWKGRGYLQKEKTALNKRGLLLLDIFLIEAFRELEEHDKLL